MRKIVRLVFLFISFFYVCFGDQAAIYIQSLDDLRKTFRIENDVLISAKKNNYNPYPFESKLHSDLAYVLKDLKQAELIYSAYTHHILPVFANLVKEKEDQKKAFIQALLEVCLLFGNSKDSPQESLIAAIRHQGDHGKRLIEEYLPEIINFVKEANTSSYPAIQIDQNTFTIVVLTTTCSGGNFSIANALTEYLSLRKGVRVIQIDTEDLAKKVDPMMIATGTHTYDAIYSMIFQKTNDFSVIPGRKKMNKEIHRYIPSNFLGILKEKIIELKPDLIISTRSYTPDDIALAALDIPFRMMNVDFELCSSLNSYYRKVPTHIKFWLQHCKPSMFKPLFQAYDALDLYDPTDNCSTVMEKIAQFSHVAPNEFQHQFEVIGYPVSSEFYHIEDQELLKDLRKKWGVKEKEIPIFIVMGKHSTAASREIFDHLLHSNTDLPLKYLFICGKNNELKNELEKSLDEQDFSIAEKFSIQGCLSSKEMNEVMNISNMGISKAGASSVIEIMATQAFVLLMHSYPWEIVNGSSLVEMDRAVYFDPEKSLMNQIETSLIASSKKKFTDVKNWQKNLDHHVDEIYKKKKVLGLNEYE